MTGKSILLALLFSFAALTQLLAQCDCVTTGNCPVPITDNGIFNGYMDVVVNGPNDLAVNPLTQVCVTITHTWIGDLSISLTSPSGVEYLIMADVGNNYGECGTQQDNAEICIVAGTNKPLSNNTEYICNSAPCSVGTCCLNGNWTLPCGGVTSPITGALQAPNCDLNDFNIPGQPANGTWTISVLDVCNMDVGTLENFSLTFANGQSCYACEADGGMLDTGSLVTCIGDPSLLLNLPPDYGLDGPLYGADDAIYEYEYVIVQNGVILSVDSDADLTALPPGSYEVYGISYLTIHGGQVPSIVGMNFNDIDADLESSTAPFCGDFSDNGFPVTILPNIPPTIVNEIVCQGECITVGSQQVCASGTVTLDSWVGCDSVVQVNLTIVQPDSVDYVAHVCTGGSVSIGGQQFTAPTEQYVQLQNYQGCDSIVHLTFVVHAPTAIITPANPPALTCTNTSVALSAAASGPGALSYAWSGPSSFTSSQPSITATTAGTYTVTVSDNSVTPACTSTASVTVANNVVPPDLVFNGTPPSICQGESFDLINVPVQDLNGTSSTITVHSGTPATPANQLPSTTVSPTATTTYYFKATKSSTCSDEIAVTLTVKPAPTSNFTATALSCLNGSVAVNFTGTAGPTATYDWFFDGGTATPGTGAGPHTVTFPFAGPKSITLIVTENGCPSTTFIQNITVEAPLATPVITCATSTDSITFSWVAVPNSTGYNVTSSVPGTQVSPTSYVVTGLMPGQQVTLTVEAIGANTCGNSTATQTCAAQNCPPLMVTISPVGDTCLTATTAPFNLQATVTGGAGNGTLSWSGPGIVDAAAGTFDPNQANIGANTITAIFQKNNCQASNTLTINVFQTPTVSLTAASPVCAGTPATVTYTGSTGAGLTANWNFGSGAATPGAGTVSQSVVWPSPGMQIVTVEVLSADGCLSELATATVQVEAPLTVPVIACTPTLDSVTFTWPAVAGADSYIVDVTTGQTATQNSDTSYTVTGLLPGDPVSIEVTAVSANTCGNTTASLDCAAEDCPAVTIAIDPVADICVDANTAPTQLVANVSGLAGGTLEFFGPGVSLSGLFDPSQANEGANIITATYAKGACNYSQDITINIHQSPSGGFSAPASICSNSAATVSFNGAAQPGNIYNWDFGTGTAVPGTGPGPHSVTWPSNGQQFITLTVESPDGCISPIYASLVQVDTPLQAPQVTCNNTTTSIEFTWPSVPGATGYTVTTSTGQTATQTGPTTWQVSGLQPLEQVCVNVTALTGSACPNASTQLCCNALPCPSNVAVSVAPVADFCLGTANPIQLQATVTGDNGTGVGNWSGPGVLSSSTGTFSASVAGFGQHTVVYTYVENGCSFSGSTIINVYQQPSANFSLDTAICLTDLADISYSGTAGANAVYTWDFDGGTASPGTGAGPHQVQWATPGTYNVSLSVVDGSCTSAVFTQQIVVGDQLAAPAITCDQTTDGVVFTWAAVPGATGYTPTGTAGGISTSDTSYVFTGLNPGQSVGIQVAVQGNTSCPLPSTALDCSALPCPLFTINIDPVQPICLTAASTPVQLVADVDGVGLAGTGTWSGDGVVDTDLGVFDPAVAGIGTHSITYVYQQVNCTYEGKIDIKIVAPPAADAGPDRMISCWESDQEVQLGGAGTTSGQGIGYVWTAATGSFPGDALVQNPKVTVGGVFTLTVTNTALGCSDSDEVLVVSTQSSPEPTVAIDPIHCGSGDKDANVTVNSVAGMEPYLYSLNGAPFVSGNVFAYLEAGDYEITVMDAEGCTGSVSFQVEAAGKLNLDLTANIVGQALVKYGESISLTAIVNLAESELDSIQWTNSAVLSCTDCLDPVATPLTETMFAVTVYKDGCFQSDSILVYVENADSPVYVPNAFSPNDDGTNDQFMIYAGPTVTRIKSFYVFDRWGELVHQYVDFDPKDPARGWNGKLDGKPMNPAVFVWFAEIEFSDGSTKVLEGDVTLMR